VIGANSVSPGDLRLLLGSPPFAVVNDFGASPQPAYLANASNVLPIPLNAELKILVRIKTLRVNCELSHNQ
jgi:hypothetical protein